MSKREYQVELWHTFTVKANSPEEVRANFLRALKREGITDRSFELNITRVTKRGQVAPEEQPKVEAPARKTTKKALPKKRIIHRHSRKTTTKKRRRT